MKINIPFTLSKDFSPSAWNFGPCFIKAREPAEIIEVIVAATNPLYLVQNAEGKTKAIHRNYLVEHGFEVIKEPEEPKYSHEKLLNLKKVLAERKKLREENA